MSRPSSAPRQETTDPARIETFLNSWQTRGYRTLARELPLNPPDTHQRAPRPPDRNTTETPTPPQTPLRQTDLNGNVVASTDSEAFGHELPIPSEASPQTSLFTFQNIGPQPAKYFHDKAKKTASSFNATNATAALFAEHHLNDHLLPYEHRLTSRIRKLSPGAVTYSSNNITDSTGASHPWGGTGMTVNRTLISHKISHSGDPTQLGRWISA